MFIVCFAGSRGMSISLINLTQIHLVSLGVQTSVKIPLTVPAW